MLGQTATDFIRSIAHPVTGIQVGVLPGETDDQAIIRYNLTVLGYDPSLYQTPVLPSPEVYVGPLESYIPLPTPASATTSSQNVAPSATPPPMGGTTGSTQIPSSGGIEFVQGTIYRLILQSGATRFDTGATYPLCSRSNTAACKPMQFATLQSAIDFSKAHGEIPVRVSSVDEVWGIVEGQIPIAQGNVLGQGIFESFSTPTMIGLALGAIFLLPKLFKKRS